MSSAPPPPPPPPGPPVMASTSKQMAPSKKAVKERSLLLSDIQKGTRLKSSRHLMNDRSGLLLATNGKSSQHNGSGGVLGGGGGSSSSGGTTEGVCVAKTNRGPPNLGDLLAGGIPKLRSTANSRQLENSEARDELKRKSQIVRAISQHEDQRMKLADPAQMNNDTSHISNMSQRRISTGTLKKPPVPGNKPALPGPKPSLSFSQRATTINLTATDKPISESQPVLCQPAKPPTPPAKPLHMRNHSKQSQTVGRKGRPVSCAPSFSDSPEATSFLNMSESPFAFPIPRPAVAEPCKAAKRPQSTVFGAQTLRHTKSDQNRVSVRPTATPPPVPKREINGSSMPLDAIDWPCEMVSPCTGTVNGSSESRSKARKRQSRSSVAEQPCFSSVFLISYDKDFEAQFRFQREKDLPPPDTFKNSHKSYPSTNPKNPANRGSSDIW